MFGNRLSFEDQSDIVSEGGDLHSVSSMNNDFYQRIKEMDLLQSTPSPQKSRKEASLDLNKKLFLGIVEREQIDLSFKVPDYFQNSSEVLSISLTGLRMNEDIEYENSTLTSTSSPIYQHGNVHIDYNRDFNKPLYDHGVDVALDLVIYREIHSNIGRTNMQYYSEVIQESRIHHGKEMKALSAAPVYTRGKYSWTLTNSHGIVASENYLLSIFNPQSLKSTYPNSNNRDTTDEIKEKDWTESDRSHQQSKSQFFSIEMNLIKKHQALLIEVDRPIQGSAKLDEFIFYRYNHMGTENQLISIKLKPLLNGDADLYVTNREDDLIHVSKEDYIWRSTNTGLDQVDIHPDDPCRQLSSSNCFIIGVLGCNEVNCFELSITLSEAFAIETIVDTKLVDLEVTASSINYFSLPIDPLSRERLVITVSSKSDFAAMYTKQYDYNNHPAASFEVLDTHGRGVYCCDSLSPVLDILDQSKTLYSSLTSFVTNLFPPSKALDAGIFPVVYASTNCIYPGPDNYTWRASNVNGIAAMIIECDELRYTANGIVYFSVSGQKFLLEANHNSALFLSCVVGTWKFIESTSLDIDEQLKINFVDHLYCDIEGDIISHGDRMNMNIYLNPDMTYGEVNNVLAFDKLLLSLGIPTGCVFYDLGCGVGKAVVVAALSKLKFKKVCGIEALPHLVEACQGVTSKIRSLHENFYGGNRQIKLNSDRKQSNRRKNATNNNNNNSNSDISIQNLSFPAIDMTPNSVSTSSNTPVTAQSQSRSNSRINTSAALLFNRHSMSPGSRVGGLDLTLEFEEKPNDNRNQIDKFHSLVDYLPLLEVIEGNFLEYDWSDGDVVFASSLCYQESTVDAIVNLGSRLKAGSKLLMLSELKESTLHVFKFCSRLYCKMSWGKTVVFVYQKL